MNRQEVEKEILKCISDGLIYKTSSEAYQEGQIYKDSRFKNELKKLTHSKANSMLEEYNKTVLSDEIKNIVVNDCKEALMIRTKFSKWVETGIIVLTVILAILFSVMSMSIVKPSPKAFETIKICSQAAFILVVTQFIFYIVLKFKP